MGFPEAKGHSVYLGETVKQGQHAQHGQGVIAPRTLTSFNLPGASKMSNMLVSVPRLCTTVPFVYISFSHIAQGANTSPT